MRRWWAIAVGVAAGWLVGPATVGVKEVVVGTAEPLSFFTSGEPGAGDFRVLTYFHTEDGRRIGVWEDPMTSPVFARPLLASNHTLVRRHRWWGDPGPWRVADPRKNFLGLDVGWLLP